MNSSAELGAIEDGQVKKTSDLREFDVSGVFGGSEVEGKGFSHCGDLVHVHLVRVLSHIHEKSSTM